MPRTSRLLIENMIYHVISRGNQKQQLFFKREDYDCYLHIIRKYKNKYRFKLYAYCIMNNHVHLILDPSDKKDLWKIMHGINMSYAKWFNYKYKNCGHIWQDRYKSFPLQKDDYLLNCLIYVEFNPVRANISRRAEEYLWSSYSARILGDKNELLDQICF